jgi:hypothetical protein
MAEISPQCQAIQCEIESFFARLEEHYGVQSMAMFWSAPLSAAPEMGGGTSRGDMTAIYGHCKMFIVRQEAEWAAGAVQSQKDNDA